MIIIDRLSKEFYVEGILEELEEGCESGERHGMFLYITKWTV